MRENRARLGGDLGVFQAKNGAASLVLMGSGRQSRLMKRSFGNRNQRAFTAWDLLIVLVTVGLVAGVLLPMLSRTRLRSKRNTCLNNLTQIGLASRIWANSGSREFLPMQTSTNYGGTMEFIPSGLAYAHFRALSNELTSIPLRILLCPDDKTRRPAKDLASLQNTNLSYFVALDADETRPSKILAGDRHLSTNGVAVTPGLLLLTPAHQVGWTRLLHKGSGNIGMADGSAAGFDSAGLQQVLQGTPTNTTRLAVP